MAQPMGCDRGLFLSRLLVIGAVPALAAALSTPLGAGAARPEPTGVIVYVCGKTQASLCAFDLKTRRERQVRLAGPDGAWTAAPSLSTDGRRLAFVRGSRAYATEVFDAAPRMLRRDKIDALSLRDDGKRLLLMKYVPVCRSPGPTCDHYGFTSEISNWDATETHPRPSAFRAADWLSPGLLVGISSYDRSTLLTVPTSGCCGRVFFRDRTWGFNSVTVSPDGNTVAAGAVKEVGGASAILLISRQTRKMKIVTESRSAAYASPAWSPDGRWLVFSRGMLGPLVIARPTARSDVRDLPVVGAEPTWGKAAEDG